MLHLREKDIVPKNNTTFALRWDTLVVGDNYRLTRWRISTGVQGCTPSRRRAMEDPAIGWIAAIIIGGIAGWLAEQFMKSDMGLLMNIVLGIVGAAVASA